MIRFISVSLQNFLSYGANTTVIDLQRKGSTLILGEDRDSVSEGTAANGTGKSSLIQALIFGVYGKTLSNISLNNLVNNINKKNMEVTVTFEKEETFYHIKRVRKGKGGNFIKFFIKHGSTNFTDKDEVTRDNIAHTNEEIEKVIGMPFDLFCRIVVFSATHMPFLDLPLPQQTKFIEELFSLTTLSEKADILKEHIKDSERSMDIARNKYTMLQDEHERHKNQIKSIQKRIEIWNMDQSTKIFDLENKIKELSNVNVEKELATFEDLNLIRSQLSDARTTFEETVSRLNQTKVRSEEWSTANERKIANIKSTLKKIEGVDVEQEQQIHSAIQELDEEIRIVHQELDQIDNLIKPLHDKIEEKTREINALKESRCPYCKQKYENATKKKKEVETELENTERKREKLRLARDELLAEITNLKDKVKLLRMGVKVGDLNELMEIKSQQSQLELSLKELSETPNPFLKLLDSFDEKDIDKKEKEIINLIKKEKELSSKITQEYKVLVEVRDNQRIYSEQLKSLKEMENPHLDILKEIVETELEPINTKEIDDLDKLIKHQKFLRNLLTKKDSFIRKALLDKNIHFLNARLQTYLSELGLPHVVEFTHDLTASISQFGKDLDFGNLSHGQQARINIALSLSFRDLLESLHTPINVFMLDEVLDEGLDAVGVEAAAKLIKAKTRDEELSTFIISHKNEIDRRFDRIMTVRMEDQFSFIQEE